MLSVAFEEDDRKFLQFAAIRNTGNDCPFTLISHTGDNLIVYGNSGYNYSVPNTFSNQFSFRKGGEQFDTYTPCLLIKLRKKDIQESTRRTAKGRKLPRQPATITCYAEKRQTRYFATKSQFNHAKNLTIVRFFHYFSIPRTGIRPMPSPPVPATMVTGTVSRCTIPTFAAEPAPDRLTSLREPACGIRRIPRP